MLNQLHGKRQQQIKAKFFPNLRENVAVDALHSGKNKKKKVTHYLEQVTQSMISPKPCSAEEYSAWTSTVGRGAVSNRYGPCEEKYSPLALKKPSVKINKLGSLPKEMASSFHQLHQL